MSDVIADGKVVAIHYTLTDDDGKVLDSSSGRGPLVYLHGSRNIVPGLENALVGQAAGAKLKVDVAPADGYGERHGPGPQAIPRRELPKDLEVFEGMPLRASGSDGQDVVLWVTKVAGSRIYVDVNHPLAGQNLHFDVEIVEMRDASAEEIEHGHAHGPDGHHHH